MAADTHIQSMLKRCQEDVWLQPFALNLLAQYSNFAKWLKAHPGTRDEKEVLAHRAREKLRTGLCDLLAACERVKELEMKPVDPPAGGTQQS